MTRHPIDPHEEERGAAAPGAGLATRLLRYALPYRGRIAVAVLLVLIVAALDLAGPVIVKTAIDGPIARASSETGDAAAAGTELAVLAAVYAGVILLYFAFRYAQSMLMSTIGKNVVYDVRVEVFDHLQRLPIAFFDRNPVGRLVTRVSNDVEALNQLFTSGVVTFLADVVVLGGIATVLLLVNASLALVTLAALPVLLAITFVFRYFARRFYREQRTHLARLNAFTQESVQGMDVIHLFVREEDSRRRFEAINRSYLETFLNTVLCYSLYFPGIELVGAAAQIGILLWGGSLVGAGELSFGEFYLFWRFLGRFFAPVRDMAERYNVMQAAMTAGERIFRVLDAPEEIVNAPGAIAPESLRGEIELRGVSFAYDDSGYAIRGVSFRVDPGRTIALVGATGSGKTTVVNLLLRFYEPQEGSVLIDGVELERYDKHALRERMALVLQDPFLFTTTVLENIRMGNPRIGEEDAIEAARRVQADEFIRRLPRRYHEELHERGATLSVGQRQLISFARALAHDPDILILDEATAHVDSETERLVQAALEELLAGRTAVVVAHRLSTIRRADGILVFHKGELRESGTHRELLDRRGIYYRLYQLHSRGGDVL